MPPFKNQYFFQFNIKPEQLHYAMQLVKYSMIYHPIANIWDGTLHEKRTIELRFTGTLGEVLFADMYQLERPKRSFGAIDGQDFGQDFEMLLEEQKKQFDIKTMRRKNNRFYNDYVLNIPSSQLHRADSLTDFYFHINIHKKDNLYIATFVGYVSKQAILANEIGNFYDGGTYRTRADGSQFQFHTDTYEIDFPDLISPPINNFIRQQEGFKIGNIIYK